MQFGKKLLGRKRSDKLHSIAGLLVGREFEGSFEVTGATYRFTYSPSMARLVGRKLELQGRLRVTDSRGGTRTSDNLKALLISGQGGIGTPPPRPRPAALQAAETSGQQQSSTAVRGTAQTRTLPEIEGVNELAFCGALFFRLDPLYGPALAVPADLSRVQFNVRLFATDETTRALHGVYSAIMDSLYGPEPDERSAGAYVGELNRLLAKA